MRVDIGVIVKTTVVSAVPAEAVHAKTDVRNHQLQCENGSNCSVQVEFLHVLLRFSCPLRLQPRVHCLWPAGRSILRFLLQCQHALRLQCTATERDGLRGARVSTRCHTRVRHTSSTSCRSLARRSSSRNLVAGRVSHAHQHLGLAEHVFPRHAHQESADTWGRHKVALTNLRKNGGKRNV